MGAVQCVLLKACGYQTLYFHGQKGCLQFQMFNFKVAEGGESLRGSFLGLCCFFKKKEIREEVY